jgi:hypothetical protein
MRRQWKVGILGLAAAVLLLPAASQAQSDCGDLNNDGTVNQLDQIRMTQCVAGGGICPAVSPGPLCGTGSLVDCGDMFADGNTTTLIAADLSQLINFLSGNPTVYDICTGPGATIACGGGEVTISGSTITANETWPAGCLVRLDGTVIIDKASDSDPATVLRLDAGARVCGEASAPEPAALVIAPGSRIDAIGTPSDPIIFTSCETPGTRVQGDWGGVLILGQGPVNGDGCTATAEGLEDFVFGGCVANDHSGQAAFVRVEFGGINFTPNNELNNWTMNGLGNSTSFNFIHAHGGNDDNHEWFGGNSAHENFIATAGGDDNADYQLGFTGRVQNYIILQEGTFTDPDRDSRGIEGDNSEFNNEALPRSNPNFCNLTMVGSNDQAAANDGVDAGVLVRRGTQGQFYNMIVQDFNDAGVEIRDVSTTQQACVDANDDGTPESLTGDLIISSTVFCDNGSEGAGALGDEHAKSGDRQEDECATDSDCVGAGDPAACCTGPGTGTCGATTQDPDCECTTEEFYGLLFAGGDVAPANGSNLAVECAGPAGDLIQPNGSDTEFPPLDAAANAACTGLRTPYTCCSGAGSGVCRELPDVRPTVAITAVSATDCSTVNAAFDANAWVGAVDPGSSCTTSGAGDISCAWYGRPWVELNLN